MFDADQFSRSPLLYSRPCFALAFRAMMKVVASVLFTIAASVSSTAHANLQDSADRMLKNKYHGRSLQTYPTVSPGGPDTGCSAPLVVNSWPYDDTANIPWPTERGSCAAFADPHTGSCVDRVTAPPFTIWAKLPVLETPSLIRADTERSGFDTRLQVYEGSSCQGLTCVAENDDESGTSDLSRVEWSGQAGTQYWVKLDDKPCNLWDTFSSGDNIPLGLRIQLVAPTETSPPPTPPPTTPPPPTSIPTESPAGTPTLEPVPDLTQQTQDPVPDPTGAPAPGLTAAPARPPTDAPVPLTDAPIPPLTGAQAPSPSPTNEAPFPPAPGPTDAPAEATPTEANVTTTDLSTDAGTVLDIPPGGDVSSLSIETEPLNGSLSVSQGNAITYTPNPGFVGVDIFSVRYCDSQQVCETKNFRVTVAATDAPPDTTSGSEQWMRSYALIGALVSVIVCL